VCSERGLEGIVAKDKQSPHVSGRATNYWLEIEQYHGAEDVNDLDFWKQQFNASPELDKVRVVRGPKENRFRPSIDPLFRSAAYTFGPQVIGVILSGMLDDGTAGLWLIKDRGGIAIVQEPEEALCPSMPRSALSQVRVDYRLPLSEIAETSIQNYGSLAREHANTRRARTPAEATI
jgi:CheB methylesterase